MDKHTIEQNIDRVLEKTDFKNLGARKQGKVRDVYTQSDKIIFVATDRYSAFDRNLALIPFKGQMLTQIAQFWFDQTKDIVPNHMLAVPDPNVMVCQPCTVLPIEVVVRGYITGVTGTALWMLYSQGQRDFGDFTLPDGLHKNQKLSSPVITPTTKSDEHDKPITATEIVEQKLVEKTIWDQVSSVALALFARGQELALRQGLILVDTKYEFGLDAQGRLMLIDEVHTPDSSRYWQAASYQERIGAGLEPEYFDKEFLRLWFKEHCDPYKDEVLPQAPKEMLAELSSRYIQIYEQMTGQKFETDLQTPIAERIEKNLEQYKIS